MPHASLIHQMLNVSPIWATEEHLFADDL